MNYILYTHVIWADKTADLMIVIKSLKKAKIFCKKSFLNNFNILFYFLSLCVFISIDKNIGRSIPLTAHELLSNWNGWDIFPEKNHLLSTSNRLTAISKNYFILNILFVNIKFYQPFMSFLEASTDHQARKPSTHKTIFCPICGRIFIKREFSKFTEVTAHSK